MVRNKESERRIPFWPWFVFLFLQKPFVLTMENEPVANIPISVSTALPVTLVSTGTRKRASPPMPMETQTEILRLGLVRHEDLPEGAQRHVWRGLVHRAQGDPKESRPASTAMVPEEPNLPAPPPPQTPVHWG